MKASFDSTDTGDKSYYSSELQEIIELARPLAKWLYDHKDPHFSIIITEDNVDLVQAVAGSPMTIIK